ncbi:MAG: riboflavin kinase [Phycisphaerales bacterium]
MPSRRVITIGNFDGVHAGHRALLARSRDLAGQAGRVVAIAFDPHPLTRLRPDNAPTPIEPWTTRASRLTHAGADEVVRLEPTPDRLAMTPPEFVNWLISEHQPDHIVEGPDFRFGHKRAGDVDVLTKLAEPERIGVHVVPPVIVTLRDQSEVVASSSMVRWLLEQGRVRDAGFVLERPHELIGTVVTGDRIGRTIGFPTANIETDSMRPAAGVYAALAIPDHHNPVAAAVHIGGRPSVNDERPRVEAHLLAKNGSWTPPEALPESGWSCTLQLIGRVRDVMKLDGLDALKSQITRDCARARDITEPLLRSPQRTPETA